MLQPLANWGNSTITITNSIFWGTTDGTLTTGDASAVTISHSDVHGGCAATGSVCGDGDIDVDPLFQTVQSSTGTWDATPYHDRDTLQMVLSDTTKTATWTASEFTGYFLNPDTSSPYQFIIVENTNNDILLWGDFTSEIMSGMSYAIYDYHLTAPSGCVDADTNMVDMGFHYPIP